MARKASYKRIGILGGLSYESTADLYELIMQKHTQRFKDAYYPEVVIFSVSFAEIIELQDAKQIDVDSYVRELSVGLRALESAGVDIIVIAANTPHMFFEQLKKAVDVPMRSIVVAARIAAQKKGYSKLLLLGTKQTMSSTFYQAEFSKNGIELIVPVREEQVTVDRIIFEDLVRGDINQASKARLVDIAESYEVEGVILGCTELSMIMKPVDTELPLLDTLEVQAEDILSHALEAY